MFQTNSSLPVKSKASCAPTLAGLSCTCIEKLSLTSFRNPLDCLHYTVLCFQQTSRRSKSPVTTRICEPRLPWAALRRPIPHIHCVSVVYNALPPQHCSDWPLHWIWPTRSPAALIHPWYVLSILCLFIKLSTAQTLLLHTCNFPTHATSWHVYSHFYVACWVLC